MRKLRIGIVGCGAIGSSLSKTIVKDFKDNAVLSALFDRDSKKSRELSRTVSRKKNLSVSGLKTLIKRSELVIEASSAKYSWEIARKALSKSKAVMIMSVGGIVCHYKSLCSLARRKGAKVYIPSGAIAGIDALKAAKLGNISRVILTTRKNPRSFKGVEYVKRKGIRLDKIKKDTVLFSGSAKDAVKFFPQNTNVAATLSIAGLGEDLTQVKIIASAATRKNIHEIEVVSQAARILARTENVLHPDNPKTSYLAVLSAVAALKGILEPVKIGT
jgi:aspartate dehydrogenase